MKKVAVFLAGWFLLVPGYWIPAAWADEHIEEPAIVNDVPNAWDEFKAVVDVLAPTAEMIYDFKAESWGFGTSGSVYEFTSNNIHLGRLKAGYLSTNSAYAGADVDLPGLVARYLGGRWAQLDTILGVVSRYASTGYVIGYDVNEGEILHGFSLGATLRF